MQHTLTPPESRRNLRINAIRAVRRYDIPLRTDKHGDTAIPVCADCYGENAIPFCAASVTRNGSNMQSAFAPFVVTIVA